MLSSSGVSTGQMKPQPLPCSWRAASVWLPDSLNALRVRLDILSTLAVLTRFTDSVAPCAGEPRFPRTPSCQSENT